VPGVAGILIESKQDFLFSSDRGCARVSIYRCSDETLLGRVVVGDRPNGLAYDPERRHLFVFNIGDPPGVNCTISVVAVDEMRVITTVPLPGRPRWAAMMPPPRTSTPISKSQPKSSGSVRPTSRSRGLSTYRSLGLTAWLLPASVFSARPTARRWLPCIAIPERCSEASCCPERQMWSCTIRLWLGCMWPSDRLGSSALSTIRILRRCRRSLPSLEPTPSAGTRIRALCMPFFRPARARQYSLNTNKREK
jgi:hypothetical protein